MTRTFKDGKIRLDNKLYETRAPYDLTVIEGYPVTIKLLHHGRMHVMYYCPTSEERKILGVKAKFIALREVQDG